MKRLLSVLGILILASALLPVQSHAGLRGAFDPITNGSGFVNGAEQAAFRPPVGTTMSRSSATAGITERFFAMTTRSLLVGSETVREMWLHDNTSQAGFALAAYKWPLLIDPAGVVSYADPAWNPNGLWLAYVVTDKNVSFSEIWVQKFKVSNTGSTAATPDPAGPPMLVVGGGPSILNRHPDWSPDGTSLVYDSNVSGSIDLWKVTVFPAVGVPTHLTFNFGKSEQMPVFSPDGTKVAYATNLFGPFILKVLDLTGPIPHPTDGDLAETNFAPVTHLNPDFSWVPGENALYYDAPSAEDINSPSQIWRLDLNTQSKCEIHIDARGSYDVDVSHITNVAPGGIQYNYLMYTSTAGNLGLNAWRGNAVFSCVPPLQMNVDLKPSSLNFGAGGSIAATLTFPPATQAAGYRCQSTNSGTIEGVRMRTSILASPTMLGLAATIDPHTGLPDFNEKLTPEPTIVCKWGRRTIEARLVALGLVDQQVPVEMTAYSNVTGRRFKGFGYLSISTSGLAGSAVRLMNNSPNPFNPVTKITFANNKAGNVELRIFNARGELVNTLAKQWFPQGEHTVTWDGRTSNGGSAPSGMYFAQVKSNGAADNMKMMLMK